MTRVTDPAPASAVTSSTDDATARTPAAGDRDALGDLVATLERACEDLFAAVPFLGDQETGARVNAYVDETVAALGELRAEADDLRRVLALHGRRAARSH